MRPSARKPTPENNEPSDHKSSGSEGIGGLRVGETPGQLRDRIQEIERVETLFVRGGLTENDIEGALRRLYELKGIDFDVYELPED